MAILGASVFLVGCGGDNGKQPTASTETIVSSTSTKGSPAETTTNTNAGPYEYKDLIKRPDAKIHFNGTNKIYRTYHFTTGTNRFNGLARHISTNGLYTIYRIENGFLHGYVRAKYKGTTNLMHHWTYSRGIKHGLEYRWHRNGQMMMRGFWTNGVRTGNWRTWHDDGSTNRGDRYLNGKYLGKSKVFLSGGLKMTWKAGDLRKFYTDKPQAIIMKGFGSPDKKKGANWIYHGVKVPDAIPNQQTVTVIFTMQKGKVAVVGFSP